MATPFSPVAKSAFKHTHSEQNFIHAVPPGMNPFLPPSDAVELDHKTSHREPASEAAATVGFQSVHQAVPAPSSAPQEQRQRRPLPRPKPNQGKTAPKPEAVPSSKPEPEDAPAAKSVVELSDLPPGFSSQDATELCEQYGKIERARLVQPGRVQVAFSLPLHASKAVSAFAGLQIPGKAGMQPVRCRLAEEDLTEEADEKGDERAAPWHKMKRSHKDRHGGWSDSDKLQLRDEVSARLTEMGNWKSGERTQRKLAKLTQHVVHEVTAQTETDAHDRMLGLYKMLTGALGADRAQAFGIWLAERLQKLSALAQSMQNGKDKKKEKDGVQLKQSQQQQQQQRTQEEQLDQDQVQVQTTAHPQPVPSSSRPPYKAPPSKAPVATEKRPADQLQTLEGPQPADEDGDGAGRPNKMPKVANLPGMFGPQFHKSEPSKAPASVAAASPVAPSKPSSPPKLRHQMYYDTWDDLAEMETGGASTEEAAEAAVNQQPNAGAPQEGAPGQEVAATQVLAPKLASPPPKTASALLSTAASAKEAATHKVLPAVKASAQPKPPLANLGTPKVTFKPPSVAEQGAKPKAKTPGSDTLGPCSLGFQQGLPAPFDAAKSGALPSSTAAPAELATTPLLSQGELLSSLQPCPQVGAIPSLSAASAAEPRLGASGATTGLPGQLHGGLSRPEGTALSERPTPKPLASWPPMTGLQPGLMQGGNSSPSTGLSLPGKLPPVLAPKPAQVVLPPSLAQPALRPHGPQTEPPVAATGVVPMEIEQEQQTRGSASPAAPAGGTAQAGPSSWENLTSAWSDFLAKPPKGPPARPPADIPTEALLQQKQLLQQPLKSLQQQQLPVQQQSPQQPLLQQQLLQQQLLGQLPQQQQQQTQPVAQPVPEQQQQPQEPPAPQQPQVEKQEPQTSMSQTTQEQQVMQQEILSLIQEQMTSRRRESGSPGEQPAPDQAAPTAQQPQPEQPAQPQQVQQQAQPEQPAPPEQTQAQQQLQQQQQQDQQQQQLYQQLEQRIQQHALLQHQMLMQQMMLQQVLQQNPQSLQAQAAAAQVQQLALMMQLEERKRLVAQQALGQS